MENFMDFSCLLITALEYPLLMRILLCWMKIMTIITMNRGIQMQGKYNSLIL